MTECAVSFGHTVPGSGLAAFAVLSLEGRPGRCPVYTEASASLLTESS